MFNSAPKKGQGLRNPSLRKMKIENFFSKLDLRLSYEGDMRSRERRANIARATLRHNRTKRIVAKKEIIEARKKKTN